MHRALAGLVTVMFGSLCAGSAFGFTLSSDQDVSTGAALSGTSGQTIAVASGDGTKTTPYAYDWDDVNGSANLDLGTFLIQASGVAGVSYTSFLLDLQRGGVDGSITGTSTQALRTTVITVGSQYSGDITIVNVGNISMGGISTALFGGGNVYGNPGAITIGSSVNRAGNVRVNYLDNHGAGNGTRCRPITVYSDGDVKIEDSLGNAGDILATASGGTSGTIGIYHEGSFKARNIDDYLSSGWTGSDRIGALIARGDVATNGASGSFEVDRILQYFTYYEYKGNVGSIDISGYTSVRINGDGTGRGIDTHSTATGSSSAKYAGNVTIEDIQGNIDIPGSINLQGANGADPAYNGILKLTSTAGTITLKDLDLAKVRTATLRSGSGKSLITGDLIGFDVNNPTNGVLDAVTGQSIFYSRRPVNNAYLNAASYILKSGGKLRSQDFGTVVVFR